jgi:hypothetical protein
LVGPGLAGAGITAKHAAGYATQTGLRVVCQTGIAVVVCWATCQTQSLRSQSVETHAAGGEAYITLEKVTAGAGQTLGVGWSVAGQAVAVAHFGHHVELLDAPELDVGVGFGCESAEIKEEVGGVVCNRVLTNSDAI